jgi:hypothetical protein
VRVIDVGEQMEKGRKGEDEKGETDSDHPCDAARRESDDVPEPSVLYGCHATSILLAP